MRAGQWVGSDDLQMSEVRTATFGVSCGGKVFGRLERSLVQLSLLEFS